MFYGKKIFAQFLFILIIQLKIPSSWSKSLNIPEADFITSAMSSFSNQKPNLKLDLNPSSSGDQSQVTSRRDALILTPIDSEFNLRREARVLEPYIHKAIKPVKKVIAKKIRKVIRHGKRILRYKKKVVKNGLRGIVLANTYRNVRGKIHNHHDYANWRVAGLDDLSSKSSSNKYYEQEPDCPEEEYASSSNKKENKVKISKGNAMKQKSNQKSNQTSIQDHETSESSESEIEYADQLLRSKKTTVGGKKKKMPKREKKEYADHDNNKHKLSAEEHQFNNRLPKKNAEFFTGETVKWDKFPPYGKDPHDVLDPLVAEIEKKLETLGTFLSTLPRLSLPDFSISIGLLKRIAQIQALLRAVIPDIRFKLPDIQGTVKKVLDRLVPPSPHSGLYPGLPPKDIYKGQGIASINTFPYQKGVFPHIGVDTAYSVTSSAAHSHPHPSYQLPPSGFVGIPPNQPNQQPYQPSAVPVGPQYQFQQKQYLSPQHQFNRPIMSNQTPPNHRIDIGFKPMRQKVQNVQVNQTNNGQNEDINKILQEQVNLMQKEFNAFKEARKKSKDENDEKVEEEEEVDQVEDQEASPSEMIPESISLPDNQKDKIPSFNPLNHLKEIHKLLYKNSGQETPDESMLEEYDYHDDDSLHSDDDKEAATSGDQGRIDFHFEG